MILDVQMQAYARVYGGCIMQLNTKHIVSKCRGADNAAWLKLWSGADYGRVAEHTCLLDLKRHLLDKDAKATPLTRFKNQTVQGNSRLQCNAQHFLQQFHGPLQFTI